MSSYVHTKRIERMKVVKNKSISSNKVRKIILDHIVISKGIDYKSIKRNLNLTDRRLSFHLNVLIRQGYIIIKDSNGLRTYHALCPGRIRSRNVQSKYVIILIIIRENKNISQAEIVKISKLPQSTASRLLKDLRDAELVVSYFDDNGIRKYNTNEI